MATHIYDKNQLHIAVEAVGATVLNSNFFMLDCSTLPDDKAISLQVTQWGTGGTLQLGWSNDPAELIIDEGWPAETSAASQNSTLTNVGIRIVPKLGRFLRARWAVAQTAGTTSVIMLPISDSSKRSVNLGSGVTGSGAHGSTISGSPIRVGLRARSTIPTAVSNDQTTDAMATLHGAVVVKPYSIPEADWQYAAAAGGIVNTTDVVAKAAGAAGIRNYITGLHLRNSSAVATEFVVKDGATVIFRTQLPASMAFDIPVTFPTPLRGTAATAVNLACVTTGAAVYANVQGYQAN